MIVQRGGKYRVVRAGTHLVEFALVIPVFFLFVFGLIEIGRGMMVGSLVTNAARTGCRIGIVPGKTTSDVTAAVDGILQRQGISGYTTTVEVNGEKAKDVSAASSADTIRVTVSVPWANTSWLPGLSFIAGNVTGRFSMPHE